MLISRRALLGSTSLIALAAVAGCAMSAGGSVPQGLIDDIGLVLSDAQAIVADLGSFLPASVQSTIAADLQQAADDFDAIKAAASAALAAPTVGTLVTLFEDVFRLIPPGILPPGLSTALAAAQVLLPIILAFVGLQSSSDMQVRAAVAKMTPDEARAAIRLYLTGRSHA